MSENPHLRMLHPATIVIEALAQLKSILGTLVILLFLSFTSKRGDYAELIIAGLGGIQIVVAVFRYITVRFGIEDGAFVLTKGMVFKQRRTIPLDKIQNINIKRGVVHRLMKVVTLEIETASGSGAEASLSVVSEEDAESLRWKLMPSPGAPVVAAEALGEAPASSPIDTSEVLYRVPFKDLLIAGATSNRALTIVASVFGSSAVFGDDVVRTLVGGAVGAGLHLPSSVLWMLAILGLLLIIGVGWIASIVVTVVKYYNFVLRSADGQMRLRYGLLTVVEAVVPLRRVQILRVTQSWLQRKLKLAQMYADTAGSFVDKDTGGSTALAPMLDSNRVAHLSKLVFPDLSIDQVDWRQVSPKTIRRGFIRTFLGWATLSSFLYLSPLGWGFLGLLPVVALLSLLYARKRYQVLGYSMQNHFILTRAGVWSRQVLVMPRERVQWVALSQDPIQKALGLANLRLGSAAASVVMGAMIVDLPVDEAIRLQDAISSEVQHLPWEAAAV